MPITKSAKRALRESLKKRVHNLFYKKKIKTLVKKLYSFVLEKKTEEAKKILPIVYKLLDKAAKEKVIKKNTAARRKSRLAKFLNRKS